MSANGNWSILIVFLLIGCYFTGIALLSKKKLLLGLILPALSLLCAIWNLAKPMLFPNPRPTMAEGMYMTFFGALALIGFIVALTVGLVTRKRRKDAKKHELRPND